MNNRNVTDVDLFGEFKAYCSRNGRNDLYEEIQQKWQDIDAEGSSYFFLTDWQGSVTDKNHEFELYFKEVKAEINRKTWFSFSNTLLGKKCALFEYIWFYGAMPVRPKRDAARLFFMGNDGYYYSQKTCMRDDGTIYLYDIDDRIKYKLVLGTN
ncbi:predicted protein [Chaetoceros tenuissimus]|uniref:Uncharacterized protein n=1 Tax=Chaetoceros tenuissimus TaxID=426638 RepID=A0AAD3HA51_9STRA|nr:predicted protein [Chaetoceros tenuissimus]